jgi:hypothetical protein
VVRQLVVDAVARERVLDLVGARVAIPGTVPAGGSVSKQLYSEHARLTADASTKILGAAAAVSDHADAAPWVDRRRSVIRTSVSRSTRRRGRRRGGARPGHRAAAAG